MLPPETNLELRSCLPAKVARNALKPPLLFVHGGFCDAWCWTPHFLPWFALQGYAAYALSLRGHGTSGGSETLFVTGLDDFATDVMQIATGLPAPPVLIGHSMGAAIVERLLATRPVRAAAVLSPVPPAGLLAVAARLATTQSEYPLLTQFDPTRMTTHLLDVLRPYYFSADVAPEILAEAPAHLCAESPRALLDLSLRVHWQVRKHANGGTATFVLGAADDRIATPDDVRATASHHGVEAIIVPGLAHMMMLERQWEQPARELGRWLATL